jgi:hypothetical protein
MVKSSSAKNEILELYFSKETKETAVEQFFFGFLFFAMLAFSISYLSKGLNSEEWRIIQKVPFTTWRSCPW